MEDVLQNAPVVETAEGSVQGVDRDGSYAFFGIPYAEAPVGDLRFAAPQARQPWTGMFDATEPGATPLVREMPDTLIPEPSVEGEDILNVNVFTPDLAPDRPMPVLFWIHGGGFQTGSPVGPWYHGESFNRDGIVVVTCSYRLGFDGFGWVPGTEKNRAVEDWLAALQWVQRNIGAFGGDPKNVTIGGQSAGATAVLTLLTLPTAQSSFHAVWASSPAEGQVPLTQATARTYRMAEELGIHATLEEFSAISRDDMFDAQAAASAPEGRTVLEKIRSQLAMTMPFGPIVDGNLIPDQMLEQIRLGVGADKPLVIGSNLDELRGISDALKGPIGAVPAQVVLRLMGLRGEELRKYVEDNGDGLANANEVGTRYATDVVFRSQVLKVAQARAAFDPSSSRTWVYSFEWPSPVHEGAIHCVDVPFFFDVLEADGVTKLLGEDAPGELAEQVHGEAVSLVKDGTVDWPQWDASNRMVRVFDVEQDSSSPDGDGPEAFVRRAGYSDVDALV